MFHTNYREARRAFRDTARDNNFKLVSYELPNLRGIEGESLTIDVAIKGKGNQLILTSGLHGIEGYAGSGCQIDCMKHINFNGIRVILIHAINPYGFSYKSRTNENGIDLNRNCGGSFPRDYNQEYDHIHKKLCSHIKDDAPPSQSALKEILRLLKKNLGDVDFSTAITGGQFRHSNGLFYGGDQPQKSLEIVNEILTTNCNNKASRTLTIDFHTGLGPSGHGELVFTGASPQPALDLVRQWLSGVTCPSEGGSVTKSVKGSAEQIFIREDLGDQVSYAALEFGTLPMEDVLLALCEDVWLTCHPKIDDKTANLIRENVFAAFCGTTEEWRTSVTLKTHKVVKQAVTALLTISS